MRESPWRPESSIECDDVLRSDIPEHGQHVAGEEAPSTVMEMIKAKRSKVDSRTSGSTSGEKDEEGGG